MIMESWAVWRAFNCKMVLPVLVILVALHISMVHGSDLAGRIKRSHTSYNSYSPSTYPRAAPPSYHKSAPGSYSIPQSSYSYSSPLSYGKRGRVSYGPRAYPSSYGSHGSSYKAPSYKAPSSFKTYSVPSYNSHSSSYSAPSSSYRAPSSTYHGSSSKNYRGGRGGFKDYSYGRCGYSDEYYGFCKERYAGHYSHPSNKDCYIQCDEWGFAYVKPCAKGTYWAHKGYGPAYYNACVAKKKHSTKPVAYSPPSFSHSFKSPPHAHAPAYAPRY